MNRLADVELQLVMHGLGIRERVAMALCNRRLLAAAHSAFAWKHAPLLRLVSCERRCSGVVESRRLEWRLDRPCTDRDVRALLRSPLMQLHELDASGCDPISVGQWHRILSHPTLPRQLRVLCMHEPGLSRKRVVDAEMLRLLAALPHLHTLTIGAVASTNPDSAAAEAAAWSLLGSSLSLTALRTNDTHFNTRNSRLPAISQCSRITDLHITEPVLYNGSIGSFRMPHLQILTLDKFIVSASPAASAAVAVQPEEWMEAFSELRQLHTLHLRRCFGVNILLPLMPYLMSLRTLIVEPNPVPLNHQAAEFRPDPAVLEQLLLALPTLHITLRLSSEASQQLLTSKIRSERDFALLFERASSSAVVRLHLQSSAPPRPDLADRVVRTYSDRSITWWIVASTRVNQPSDLMKQQTLRGVHLERV